MSITFTPEQVGTLVTAGTSAAQFIFNVIAAIRGSSLSPEEKEAAIAKIRAELRDDVAEVKADAAHVRAVDPIPDPAPTAR